MRRALCVALGLILLTGLSMNADAARRHGKRAKVHRVHARASAERLVDLGKPATPNPAPGDPAPSDPPLASFVSVAAKEFSLTLSRPLVGKGGVRIELRNTGEDPHNLVVSPAGTHTPLASFSTIDPGTYERRSVTLNAGRYQLWCSLEGHETKGMSVTLRVE